MAERYIGIGRIWISKRVIYVFVLRVYIDGWMRVIMVE